MFRRRSRPDSPDDRLEDLGALTDGLEWDGLHKLWHGANHAEREATRMLSFTLSGQELFQDLPEPVFWTCRETLAYWNRSAERLCKEADIPLEEGGALPAALELLEGTEERAADVRLAGRLFHGLAKAAAGGRLYLLRPAAEDTVLSDRRISFLMDRMRGPMANLYAAMQMLTETEERAPQEIMHRNYCRLLRMMNEVEFSYQLAHAEASIQPVVLDLAGLCREVIRQTEPLAKRYGRRLCYEEEMSSLLVLGDSGLLEKLIYHLVSNAWRASEEGGLITLRLGKKAGRAVLTVSDQGGGISSWTLSSIFDPNAGGEELTDVEAGAGLGIPICRHIAELHRGTLVVENSAGQGVAVTLSLPSVRQSGGSLHHPPLRYEADGGIPRVLLELSDVLPHEAFGRRELE